SIQIQGPEEIVLQADPDRLRQVLENLLANAVQHAPKHTLPTRPRMKVRSWVECAISLIPFLGN
ncbi:MAG TPA: hypothetical protein VFN35_33935, partial [Ktedonobacteraceae bacterium]|nr:hypothetical protein [Ktedonobacteraceae bacterium]